jgi:hypothetical protein
LPGDDRRFYLKGDWGFYEAVAADASGLAKSYFKVSFFETIGLVVPS